jgi:hypothetical protein
MAARRSDVSKSLGEGGRNASLTGFWTGAYWYSGVVPASLAGGAPFNAYLEEEGGMLSGTTLEINTFANLRDAGGDLEATLFGMRSGSEVTFTKRYNPTPGVHQTPIRYAGHVDPALSRIEGEWRFDDPSYPSGAFRLERLTGGARAEKRELVTVQQTVSGRSRQRRTRDQP